MYKFHKDHTEPTNKEAVFVFGSNLAARHGGGAALLAKKKYGALPDVAEGIAGNSYAIPTKDKKIETLPLDAIKVSVQKFIDHASANPSVEFFMTRIGCVLAGYENKDIAPMFVGSPENIDFPDEWKIFIGDEQVITTYKGFDTDMKCRGFQYEIGGTVEHKGKVEACGGGFHACEYPLDVFGYYPPNTSRFAIVQQSGDLSREAGGDTKLASRKLTVKAEIGIPGIIKAAIEYTFKRALPIDEKSPAYSDGTRGAASATGTLGAASATGTRGAASATGASGAASATGDSGAASATGDSGAASATGTLGAASATGTKSVAMASGRFGKAKAELGCAIFLTYRDDDWNIVHARSAIVGKDGIKANVWYSLNSDGELMEA